MFEKIIQRLASTNDYSEDLILKVEDICNYWSSISDSTSSKLKEIVEKYQYENLKNIRRDDSQTTHLEFWKDIGIFSLSPALEDHDIDDDFMLFIEDFHGKINFSNVNEIEDEELDIYYELLDRLFYTWISFLWQECDGSRSGIPTCTVENNSIRMFYFNDFLFDNISSFHNEWFDKRIDGTAFNRKLAPEEIFARTNRNIKRANKTINWIFERDHEHIELTINNNVTSIKNSDQSEEEVLHEPNTNYDNSHEVAAKYFIERSNELINDNWKLKEKK
ncbi:hypothetical protein V6R21_23455 [Limibacter armeniacum]|uniref:hypothetical protein n=1 Tax=Limibacter armeniacum TaxID=466084 RepID=UPI002FE5F759